MHLTAYRKKMVSAQVDVFPILWFTVSDLKSTFIYIIRAGTNLSQLWKSKMQRSIAEKAAC